MDKIVEKIIFSKFDLPLFMEQQLGSRLQRLSEGKYKCSCPFPFHKDNKPSFSIDHKNGGWVWYCYGCACGGTTVHFFQKYYGVDYDTAIEKICLVGDIKSDLSAYLEAMSVTVNLDRSRKEIENYHIDLCSLCRHFLRDFPGDREAVKWTKDIYDRANKILETMDSDKMKELLQEVRSHVS